MTFLIQQTLIYAVPLMIVALAGVFAERSGIINLALEGIMIFGAFIGVLFVNLVQQIFVPGALSQFEVLLTVILMLAGMQMMFLYIIGSYLAKDCMENKRRPVYIIKEKK